VGFLLTEKVETSREDGAGTQRAARNGHQAVRKGTGFRRLAKDPQPPEKKKSTGTTSGTRTGEKKTMGRERRWGEGSWHISKNGR